MSAGDNSNGQLMDFARSLSGLGDPDVFLQQSSHTTGDVTKVAKGKSGPDSDRRTSLNFPIV